ncbi:MAG: geranylgeranyl reductase family protein [Calditrichaeota bacterium]|nr:geranylgeranyl reductase family protein [Calditrichota bacterium]
MKKSASYYPVVIVGAGPAGSAAAIYFSRKGIQPLLVDKARFPRDKICGDGIPLKTFQLLTDLGFDEQQLFANGFKIHQLRVYSPDYHVAVFGGLKPDASTKSGCIPRLIFDHALFEKAAEAACETLTQHKLESMSRQNGRWLLELRDLRTNDRVPIETDLLIGADGGKSRVARLSGLLTPTDAHRFDGLRVYYEGKRFDPAVHLFYDRKTLPGYLWIFPVSETRANVGIMMDKSCKQRYGKTIRQIFEEVLQENPRVREVLEGARPVDRIRGAPLPLGTLPGRRVADGLILIGDAAAFINPVTGGGIYYAILSAKFAAEFGVRALQKGDTSWKALLPYEEWWRRTILPGFIYSGWLKNKFKSEKFTRWFLRKVSENRIFANFFIAVYGRPLPRYTFINPLFWLKIFLLRR